MSENEAAQAARRASCSRTAASSPSASPRRRTAPTSTRPTWCSRPRRRRLHAPTAASTTSATATRRRSSRPSAGAPTSRARTTTSSSPPTRGTSVRAGQERRQRAELRLRVRARRLPGRAPRTSCTRGQDAWDAALNTVNIGKYNLGWASIGICTHALYEAITHADDRVLYDMRVTDFPHVRQTVRRRLRAAGRDEALRAPRGRLHALGVARGPPLPALQPDGEDEGDHRGRGRHQPALGRDRRQGLREGHVLRDGRARHPRPAEARGHGAREHRADREVHGRTTSSPRPSYRAGAAAPRRRPTTTSSSTRARRAGSARSASTTSARASTPFADLPNVARFAEQAEVFGELLADGAARRGAAEGPRLPARGRRALRARRLRAADPREGGARRARRRRVDQIFDFLVRDFSAYAVELHGKTSSTEAQQAGRARHRTPVADADRFDSVSGRRSAASPARTRCAPDTRSRVESDVPDVTRAKWRFRSAEQVETSPVGKRPHRPVWVLERPP